MCYKHDGMKKDNAAIMTGKQIMYQLCAVKETAQKLK